MTIENCRFVERKFMSGQNSLDYMDLPVRFLKAQQCTETKLASLLKKVMF